MSAPNTPNNPQPESITLYNKTTRYAVYIAALVEVVGGWVVTYQNAGIGKTLPAPKRKTPNPLPFAEAKAAYDKLVADKMKNDYKPEDGAAASGAAAAVVTDIAERQTGVLPQLLNFADESEVERLLGDDEWGAEEKFDGMRLLLKYEGGQLVAINRKGLSRGTQAGFVADALALGSRVGDFILDGEAVGDTFKAFDLLAIGGRDLRPRPYRVRRASLVSLFDAEMPHLHLSALASTAEEKRALYERLVGEEREGIVFKRLAAPYTPGRPNRGGDQLKVKFYATATFIVQKHNQRRSVALCLLDEGGAEVGVGNVTIPANAAVPPVGALVEVRYLYAHRGGAVFQATFQCVREDIERSECLMSQLKYKAGTSEDEEDALAA
jgi:bifunctional non-homologous end joining protein LigD